MLSQGDRLVAQEAILLREPGLELCSICPHVRRTGLWDKTSVSSHNSLKTCRTNTSAFLKGSLAKPPAPIWQLHESKILQRRRFKESEWGCHGCGRKGVEFDFCVRGYPVDSSCCIWAYICLRASTLRHTSIFLRDGDDCFRRRGTSRIPFPFMHVKSEWSDEPRRSIWGIRLVFRGSSHCFECLHKKSSSQIIQCFRHSVTSSPLGQRNERHDARRVSLWLPSSILNPLSQLYQFSVRILQSPRELRDMQTRGWRIDTLA